MFERAKVGVGVGPEPGADSRQSSASIRDSMRSEGTVLGRNVVVESNAVVEAAEVGEGTVVEVGAKLGRGCTVGKVCTSRSFKWGHVLIVNSIVRFRPPASFLHMRTFRTIRSFSVAISKGLIRRYCSDPRFWRRR